MTVYHLLQVCILVVLLSTSWYHANFSLSYLITYLITSSLVVCFLDDCYKRDGRKWPYFQQLLIWRWLIAYFDGGISLETPLDSQQQYIFCSFPHGTCTASHLLTMTNGCGMLDKVHGGDRRDLCATVLFFVPVFREMLLWLGCVDAGTRTAHHNLKCGRSILIFVGGEKEQLMTTPGVHQIFLNNRKGFVKLALEYGSPLVPLYAFGENEVFHVSKLFLGFRVWLQHKFQLGIPLVYGRWGLFPLKVRIHVEIGKPLLVAKKRKEDITQADIDALHAKFVQSMQDLFERTKRNHGCTPDTKLIIH